MRSRKLRFRFESRIGFQIRFQIIIELCIQRNIIISQLIWVNSHSYYPYIEINPI